MKQRTIICLIVYFFLHSGFVFSEVAMTHPPQNPSTESSLMGQLQSFNVLAPKYILGPNDVINVNLYGIPNTNSQEIRIQPDGKISFDMIGSMQIAGLTLEQLEQCLTEKYSEYYQDPKISINLIESKPFIVYVLGAVLTPGSYEVQTMAGNNRTTSQNLHPDVTINRLTPLLSSVLISSGGLSFDADLEHIEIRNSVTGQNRTINMLDLLVKKDTSQDVYLIAGDTVYVPRLASPLMVDPDKYKLYASSSFSPRTVPVKVYGYVNTPGLISLNTAQSLNLLSAITAAGGYLKDSAYTPSKVIVYRADEQGNLAPMRVNPLHKDIQLMPNDIVYVPQKIVPRVGLLFDFLDRVSLPLFFTSQIYRSTTGNFIFK